MIIYAATTDTARCALAYHRAGLAILPLRTDGSKASLIKWASDGWKRPTWEELAPYFKAVLAGRQPPKSDYEQIDDLFDAKYGATPNRRPRGCTAGNPDRCPANK